VERGCASGVQALLKNIYLRYAGNSYQNLAIKMHYIFAVIGFIMFNKLIIRFFFSQSTGLLIY